MEIQNCKDSTVRKANNSCNMRHYKHNSRIVQQGCKISTLQFKVASTGFQPFNCINFELKEQKLRPLS